MRNRGFRLSILLGLLVVVAVGVGAQAPPPQGDRSFVGRWDLQVQPPAGVPAPAQPVSFAVIEISSTGGVLVGRLLGALTPGAEVSALSAKDNALTIELRRSGSAETLTLTGKRVGDRLELAGTVPGAPAQMTFIGVLTAKDAVAPPAMPLPPGAAAGVAPQMRPPAPDRQAFNAANVRPREERIDALRKFLTDFPDSTLKESASLLLAQSLATLDERVAALRQFITDFPNSADEGYLQIAIAPSGKAERIAGLRTFVAEHPGSPLKPRAESALKRLTATEADAASMPAVRVGGNIRPPVKLVNVNPVYPAAMQEARTQGVVIIEAMIDINGNVGQARILRSIPGLDEAALEAVKQWKFSATELDGVPVPVIMTVTVNFTLK